MGDTRGEEDRGSRKKGACLAERSADGRNYIVLSLFAEIMQKGELLTSQGQEVLLPQLQRCAAALNMCMGVSVVLYRQACRQAVERFEAEVRGRLVG